MTAPVVVRLTSMTEAAASIPLYLGYRPTESIVLICCHEPRGRIGLTLRFDLPPDTLRDEFIVEAAMRIASQNPTRILVAVYSDAEHDGALPHHELVTLLLHALEEPLPDLILTDAFLARSDRCWSYTCTDTRCCPPQGQVITATPAVDLLEAEQVRRGQRLVGTRDDLEASYAPRPNREMAVRITDTPTPEWPVAAERWADAMASPPSRSYTDSEAAFFIASLRDVRIRDSLVSMAASQEDDEALTDLRTVLEQLVQRVPAPLDAAVCTVLAWTIHLLGSGAEVTILTDRALRSDPDYSLAHLLRDLALRQIPPRRVRELTAGSTTT